MLLEYLRKKCTIALSCIIGLSGAATIAADAWVYADSEDYSKVILIASSTAISSLLVTSVLIIKACMHKKGGTVITLSEESMKELVERITKEVLGVAKQDTNENVIQVTTFDNTSTTSGTKGQTVTTVSIVNETTSDDGVKRQSSADSGIGPETISDLPASKLNRCYCHHCGNKLVVYMV